MSLLAEPNPARAASAPAAEAQFVPGATLQPALPSGGVERNALGEESRLPSNLRKHRFPRRFVCKVDDRDIRGLVYFGADPEEAARRAGIEAELRGWKIVDQEWDGFVLSGTIRAGDPSSQTRVRGAAHSKCVVYRAGSRAGAKQRAAADSELHHWTVLEAHWRPAPNNQGGALVLQVEEPES